MFKAAERAGSVQSWEEKVRGRSYVFNCLTGLCREHRARLFVEVNSGRMRGNRHKLQQGKFQLDSHTDSFSSWGCQILEQVPTEAVESLSLEIHSWMGP